VHGQSYSLPTLRDHLVTGGYDPQLVDEAVAAYRAEIESSGRSEEPKGRPMGCTAGTFLLGLFMVFINGLFFVQTLKATGVGGLILFLTLLVGELGTGLWLSRQRGPDSALSKGLGAGLIVGVVLTGALFLLIAGVCAQMASTH
jgi:hypothetical protein